MSRNRVHSWASPASSTASWTARSAPSVEASSRSRRRRHLRELKAVLSGCEGGGAGTRQNDHDDLVRRAHAVSAGPSRPLAADTPRLPHAPKRGFAPRSGGANAVSV